jgi:hypothetical protein
MDKKLGERKLSGHLQELSDLHTLLKELEYKAENLAHSLEKIIENHARPDSETTADAHLIKSLGGPTKVAEMLNFEKPMGVQRVSNWTRRGIPYHIKVKHKEIFLSQFSETEGADEN